ncbi:RtcB family protein, partial [Candidatus Poribacteria bacterium]|nr:RtcB family protein [Candidatus Poribacteria bacterium]
MAREIPMEKIDEYRWRIPKSYMQGMRVDGIIYANEKLLEQAKSDEALQQVANVAHLPGIIKYSLAMPDLHWGYGFVIGGVAATDPHAEGVVSPGGIGYDINCLSGDAEILHQHGYTLRIGEMEPNWQTAALRCQDFQANHETQTSVLRYLKLQSTHPVYCLKTEGGDIIKATADHPFWTPNGMTELRILRMGDSVALSPFQGVPYEEPSDEIIVDEAQIEGLLDQLGDSQSGSRRGQVIKHLKERNLLPLRYNSPATPYLLKILGYVMGDGNIHYVKGDGKGRTSFYGKAADLDQIREDILRIGFTPSKLHHRERAHQITTTYDTYQFSCEEVHFGVSSTAFATLLIALGTPHGKKASQDYRAPQWIQKAPLWQKRLFLAALFGAELESPATMTGHPYTISAPKMSMNKRESYVESGVSFLRDISELLADFGVQTRKIGQRKEQVNVDGSHSYRLQLVISGTNENLIKLWGRIGFEYNAERKALANIALQYLKLKQRMIEGRENAAQIAVAMHANGMSIAEITDEIESEHIDARFIERSVYEERQTKPRVSRAFPTFEAYIGEATKGLGKSGMVWDRIESITPLEFDDYVYDFTVAHPDHNFVANGFVVSNCGVRLMRTNLNFKQLEGKTKSLVAKLFESIPCGVGSSGKIRLTPEEEKRMLEQGSSWAIEREYGLPEDLQFTEAHGFLELANADAASKRALERGKNQLGTLGSGNHFLEVQVVDRVL